MNRGAVARERCKSRAARRRSWSVACAGAALLAALVAVSAGTPNATGSTARAFNHRSHVSTHWYGAGSATGHGLERDAEYARDCRGCHDPASDERPDPQQVCARCHFDQVDGAAPAGGWIVRVDGALERKPADAMRASYRHVDHTLLACRECHQPVLGDEDIHVPSAGDAAFCMRCHDRTAPAALERVICDVPDTRTIDGRAIGAMATDPTVTGMGANPARAIELDRLHQRLVARLNADPRLVRAGRGPFLHGDHLQPLDLASPAKCAVCHAAVATSNAVDLGDKAFDQERCAACHVDADASPVRVASTSRAWTGATASTFAHSQHLRAMPSVDASRTCTSESAREIADRSCLACHALAHGASGPTDFALRADRSGYPGCITCHDVERFKTKDHGHWGACTACHTFDRATLNSDRVVAQVMRAAPGAVRFLMPQSAHPGLKDQPAQQCSECHKVALPPVVARTHSARFDHAQHVGQDAPAGSCSSCHRAPVEQSDGSARIGHAWKGNDVAADAATMLTFDPSACTSCHPGIAIDPASLARAPARTVPEFSHKQHLAGSASGAPAMQCSACHVLAAGKHDSIQLVQTLDSAMDCSACHRHDAAHAAWTGKIEGSDVQSCAVCHADQVPPITRRPAASAPIAVVLNGAQFHPDDRACNACHLDVSGSQAPSAAIVRAEGALFTIHANNKYPVDCRSCHWALELASLGNQSPTLDARRREGARLTDFPGGPAVEAMRRRFLDEHR